MKKEKGCCFPIVCIREICEVGDFLRAKTAVVLIVVILVCVLLAGRCRGAEGSAGVTFPVLSDMELDISNPEFVLQNPVENKGRYILKYEFSNIVTGDVFFSTNWLEGGKQYHYSLEDMSGTILCRVHIYAKNADTYEDVSGVDIFIKIGVKSYET